LLVSIRGARVSSVKSSQIDTIFVDAKGGDDQIELQSQGSHRVKQASFLFGGSGNDNIRGGAGADEVDGGTGEDTIDYSKYTAGIEIYLDQPGDASGVRYNFEDRDTLINIEDGKGGSGSDWLEGDDTNNKFWGNGNDDYFVGGEGSDQMFGGDGDDQFDLTENVDKKDTVDGGNGSDDTAFQKHSKDQVTNCEEVIDA
jgi:Ca2+-binding RTX toxin-like protein